MSGRIRILVGVAVLVGLGVGAWFYLTRNRESTDDAQVDAHIAPVAPKVSGNIAEVLVDDNQISALYRYNQARADVARATGQMESLYAN